MKTRPIAVVLALATLASCGGRAEPLAIRTLQPRSISLPDPIIAKPSFRMIFDRPVTAAVIKKVERQHDVAAVATIRSTTMRVRAGNQRSKLKVGAVAPLRFRSVSPQPTRAAEFVWTSLIQGQIVVTPETAGKLGLTNAATLEIGDKPMNVGAFADNGVPNLVDVMISNTAARDLEIPPARQLVVGTERKAKLDEVRRSLERSAPGAAVKTIRPVTPPVIPENVGQAQGSVIGTMTFRIKKNGFIEPDPAWISANIVSASVPILGHVTCHRLLIPQLAAALAEIEKAGLAHLIDPSDYGGCYVPRFIGRDSRRALSMHAFGLALDINVSRNYYGTSGHMDVRIIEIFDKWGFRWGGYWSDPDPMHFEMNRLIQM